MSLKQQQQRHTQHLKVNPEFMGKLIGRGGCNIRRITSKVRSGCFIRGHNDTFTISAWTQIAVQKASEMLSRDLQALHDPSKKPSKPFAVFKIDPAAVPHIVGRNGHGLRTISNTVGDGCYILHRDGAFHIYANSQSDLHVAEKLILTQQKLFLDRTTQVGQFHALVSESDDDDDYLHHFPPMNPPQEISNVSLIIQDIPQVLDQNIPVDNFLTNRRSLTGSWADAADTDSDSDDEL
jgi:phosphate starvation-inducible protein PhoH